MIKFFHDKVLIMQNDDNSNNKHEHRLVIIVIIIYNNNDDNSTNNSDIINNYLSIYIPWPFPPVWGVADNTKETNKNNGGFTPFFQQ